MFEFFRWWLILTGVVTAAGGVALVLFGGSPIFGWMNRLLDPAFWPGVPDESIRRFRAWVYGVTGACVSAWGVTVAFVAAQAFPARAAWAWWAVAGSVAVWFALDTAQSLRYRVFANALGNVAFLVVLAIPLAGTFGDFH
jgi:hypothetical protein